MNPIICPVRNNLHLTKQAVKTFRAQDIDGGVELYVINNGSSDNTAAWLAGQKDVYAMHFYPQLGVAGAWNYALQHVFREGAEYALVVNNDVELRKDTYRLLVADKGGFVTCVGNIDPECVKSDAAPSGNKRPHPDFSCYLIRKETYEKVGPFDEGFKTAFCEDWDYHVRIHKCGIAAYCIDLPFLHHASMTIKNASKGEQRELHIQAEKNREYFRKKHGMVGASKEYEEFFSHAVSH